MSADPFRDRTERSDGNYPQNWPRPEAGDFIIGEVTHIELSAGQYEQPVLAVLCEDKNVEFSVWLPKYMKDEIVGTNLQVGERISVKYFGVKKARSGREYQHYQLMIDPRSRIAAPQPTPEQQDAAHERAFSNPAPEPAPSSAMGGPFGDDDDLPF